MAQDRYANNQDGVGGRTPRGHWMTPIDLCPTSLEDQADAGGWTKTQPGPPADPTNESLYAGGTAGEDDETPAQEKAEG